MTLKGWEGSGGEKDVEEWYQDNARQRESSTALPHIGGLQFLATDFCHRDH